jgi:adenylate kinase family enzyme
MSRPLVALFGLPCSGKSTLVRRLSRALQLPILEELFEVWHPARRARLPEFRVGVPTYAHET